MTAIEYSKDYGWAKLVNPLIRVLKESGCYVLQSKEKYGEFRCYWSPPDSMSDDMMKVLQHATDFITLQSRATCYDCGDATDTKICTDGWQLPLCKSCAEATGRDWEGGIKPTAGWLTTEYKVNDES
jgi:hypothetical protein